MKFKVVDVAYGRRLSHPARGAWIEICAIIVIRFMFLSHPARGAWIEMLKIVDNICGLCVAPRKGCVD